MTSKTPRVETPRQLAYAGGALHVVEHSGQDPAIVAMHGFPDDSRIYDRLVPHLSGRRVVTFDWLGYGQSERRQGASFDPSGRQRELLAVLDSLEIPHALLLGHDASGPEAVDFAVSQPDRVAGVVLLNTYYGRGKGMHLPEMIRLFAESELKGLADALVDDEALRLWLLQFTARGFGLDPDDPSGVATVSILPQFFAEPDRPGALAEIRAWTADLPGALDRQDGRIGAGDLAALEAPVTLIFGTADPYLTPDLARHLAGLFRSGELHMLDGASHWPQWDQPEIVARLIEGASLEHTMKEAHR